MNCCTVLLYHHLFIFSKIYGHLGSFVIVAHYNIVNNLVHVFCETDLHMSFGHVTTALSAAERSYPTSEVRGRSREDPMPEGRQPRGVTPRPRSGTAAGRRYPMPQDQGQGRQRGGATPQLRPGAVAGRTNPTSKELWLRGCRRA